MVCGELFPDFSALQVNQMKLQQKAIVKIVNIFRENL